MMVTIESIEAFITSSKKPELLKQFNRKPNIDPGFNAFALMSSIYYRENFHSDVIAAILDIDGKHTEGNKYLQEFLMLINNLNVKVDSSLYEKGVSVSREKGRRDITIIGQNHHAIIIENKINDAHDTFNQIPNYVQQLEKHGYHIDAIVYLTLNQRKAPDESTWQVDEKTRSIIKEKIVPIRAFDGSNKDLCEGWLERCIKMTTHFDSLAVLRQYKEIIKYLTRNHMDLEFFAKFDETLKQNPENGKVAIGIKETLEKYPHYLLIKVSDYFKTEKRFQPFSDIRFYTSNIYYLYDYQIQGFSFSTDIIMQNLYECKVDFSVRTPVVEYKQIHPELVLHAIGMIHEFKWNNAGRYEHTITGDFIYFENKMIAFTNRFLQLLKNNEEKITAALETYKLIQTTS